jgi:IS1 family transposase
MRKLSREKRELIISTLVDGVGVNAATRICKVSKLTVLRLLADVGSLCRDLHDLHVQKVPAQRVQVDELWSFVGCKNKAKLAGALGHGDAWVWVGIDSETKVVISYHVGDRGGESAREFVLDLASRVSSRIQLTSDAHYAYFGAVRDAFGKDGVDYATATKLYGNSAETENRYSQGECIGCRKLPILGLPDADLISTSHVERQNLTVRLGNRRLTRLTLGFSKKVVNHIHALDIFYFHYNFIRKHKTLKTTPAVAARIADKEWSIADMVDILEKEENTHANGGRINKADRT